MINIQEVETQLLDLLAQDKKHWVQIYRLMDQVDKEKAYTTSSYTQWVNELALKAKVHVSLLWARKKAGGAYDAYAQRAKAGGKSVTPLEDVNISPDNIVLVTKIAGNNEKVADDLMDKVVKNELHRTDLQKAWKEVKEERVSKGLAPTRLTRHDAETVDVKSATDTVSAKAILYAIENSKQWLIPLGNECAENACYKVIPELAVRPGSSHYARRIDAAVFEDLSNNTSRGDHGITVHGIEVKVSKSDLLNDTKMAEYTYFCDYFWLAIPKDLLESAKKYVLDSWGILVFDAGVIKCYQKPVKLEAIKREESLIEAIKRLR